MSDAIQKLAKQMEPHRTRDEITAVGIAGNYLMKCKDCLDDWGTSIEWLEVEQSGHLCLLWHRGQIAALAVITRDEHNWSIVNCCKSDSLIVDNQGGEHETYNGKTAQEWYEQYCRYVTEHLVDEALTTKGSE